MAHFSAEGPARLAPESIEAVRAALGIYVEAPADGETLRLALADVSSEARQKSIPPEQLLVVLKAIWHSLPSANRIYDPTENPRLLQRVVTMCIKEYYLSQ